MQPDGILTSVDIEPEHQQAEPDGRVGQRAGDQQRAGVGTPPRQLLLGREPRTIGIEDLEEVGCAALEAETRQLGRAGVVADRGGDQVEDEQCWAGDEDDQGEDDGQDHVDVGEPLDAAGHARDGGDHEGCGQERDDADECGHLYTGGDGIHVDRKNKQYHRYAEPPREAGVLYADVVDLEDKQFIFQWAIGGVSDVNKFRDELAATVGAVQPGEDMADSSEPAAVDH